MTITPTNIFDLENTVKLAQSCGAKFFSWSPATPFRRGKDLAWKWDPSKATAIFDLEKKVMEEYKGFVVVLPKKAIALCKRLGNCGLGHKNAVLSPSGKIRPCLFLPEGDSTGDLRKESLEKVFRNPIAQFFHDLKEPGQEELCEGCKYRAYCGSCIVRPLKVIEREGRLCVWAKTNRMDDWLTCYKEYPYDPQRPIFVGEQG
jgi:radical SAM protein with 4Fe4S-binding SPASM domain